MKWKAGERYSDMAEWEPKPGDEGVWAHLGWHRVELEPGRAVLAWEPSSNHAFRAGEGWIVHGGMVTALLDTAMGNATWTLMNRGQVFLTADLRTEFYRPTVPGPIRATGWVVHKTKRVTFAAAEIHNAEGQLLASGRATNITIDADAADPRQRHLDPPRPDRG
ncbi:MAG: PaaI family thioesterase [Candidatus Dormibacteria bacterium]